MKTIRYGQQEITESDIQAVVDTLRSDYLTQGPRIAEFEAAFAAYTGAAYAIAVSSGTAALHLCTLALNTGPGQKVITTPITFAASANCVRYAGGDVEFADINPETYLLDIAEVQKKLESAPKGTYAGIIPVDFAGKAADLEAFRELADAHNCWIIEDACHAPGGFFTDRRGKRQQCGNGNFADLAIFSFHPVKHIAAGEGGMITTNNRALAERIRTLRTHGIQQDPAKRKYNHGIWYYEMQELGYNYRLTDIASALGLSQLKRAEAGMTKRHTIAAVYNDAFSGKPWLLRQAGVQEGHAYHLYVIETDRRDALLQHLRDHNIFAQVHYIPVHLMPYYQQFGWKKNDFPHAETYYSRCLSLPMYPSLTPDEQQYVITTINGFFHG